MNICPIVDLVHISQNIPNLAVLLPGTIIQYRSKKKFTKVFHKIDGFFLPFDVFLSMYQHAPPCVPTCPTMGQVGTDLKKLHK